MDLADYFEFHPYGDKRTRIISDNVLNKFKDELYKIMGSYDFEFSVLYGKFAIVESIEMAPLFESPLFIYYPVDNTLKLINDRRKWPRKSFDRINTLIVKELVNEENIQNQRR